MDEDESMNVLFVCTGNVYRSVIAERILTARLPTHSRVRVASAGTNAMPGVAIDPATRSALEDLGTTGDGFVSRRLTRDLVLRADLLLGMERKHRDAAVQLAPATLPRCFTLREFLRLKGQGKQRGIAAPVSVAEDALPDPWGQPYSVLKAASLTIEEAVSDLAILLTRDEEP